MAAKTAPKKKTLSPPGKSSHRDLMRMKKELQVRIREIELDLAGRFKQEPGDLFEVTDTCDDGNSIIAMVQDLHTEIDAAYGMREELEAELDAMKNQLTRQKSLHTEHQARSRLIEAKAALVEQLQRDLEVERKKGSDIARRLDEVVSRLERVTRERDDLKEQNIIDTTHLQEVQADMVDLETKVSQLEAVAAEMNQLRESLAQIQGDFAKTREESDRLQESEQTLKVKLDVCEVARNAMELDLTTTREVVCNQNEQMEELKDKLAVSETELTDLRSTIQWQEAEIAKRGEESKQAQSEATASHVRLEALQKELQSSKKALRDVHNATMRTARQVLKR